jgi:hypothetical protein
MKYYLSLCCIIKDERNLEEFIIFHNIVGVEHFYIYDNNSSHPIRDRLNLPYFRNICTIIDFPGKCKQIEAYNDCINKTKNETNWLIICDGDEYIVPKKENYWSIRDFLNEYEHAHAIGINWVLFGTSFHDNKKEGYLMDNYRYSGEQNFHIKTICKPLYTLSVAGPHNVNVIDPTKYIDAKNNILNGPFNENYTIDIIQMNHYHSKSVEELHEKYHRGNADSELKIGIPENPHNEDNNILNNYAADKYLEHIKGFFKDHINV